MSLTSGGLRQRNSEANSDHLNEISGPSLSHNGLARDLNAARSAYDAGDVELSRAAHTRSPSFDGSSQTSKCEPGHAGKLDELVNAFVRNGINALVFSVTLLSVACAGNLRDPQLLIVAVPFFVAGAVALGFHHYRTELAIRVVYTRERKREKWELQNFPHGEIEEMVELYVQRGMQEKDARQAILLMSKYEEFFVDVMMVQELGLIPPNEQYGPIQIGLCAATSFAFFGLFPVGAYVTMNWMCSDLCNGGWNGWNPSFIVALCAMVVGLILLCMYENAAAHMPDSKVRLFLGLDLPFKTFSVTALLGHAGFTVALSYCVAHFFK